MSGLGAWIWGTSQLDDAIDKATSELLPAGSEDIALNLEICDQIRSKSAPAKDAMRGLKRRLGHKNPNVQLLALSLTDICVKNGGDAFLAEVSSREFMDNLVSILKMPNINLDLKNSILRHIQNWSIAFEGKSGLSYVGSVYKTLQNEGFKFPPKDLALTASAMIDTQTAPEWIDSDVCLRCRTPFTFTNRKHHCRNCGQVFDQACSSKSMPLPHFGITQDVRVCEGCYSKLSKKAERARKKDEELAAAAVAAAHKKLRSPAHHHHLRTRTAAQDLEDAELQRAIQASLREVNGSHSGYAPSQPEPSRWQVSEPPIAERDGDGDDDDADLKAAIEASLRDAQAPRASAPMAYGYDESSAQNLRGLQQGQEQPSYRNEAPTIPNYDLDPLETDAILTFNQTVEQLEAVGGRDISKYPAMTALYEKAGGLRAKMAMSLDDTNRKHELLSEMNNKLSEAVRLYDQILTQQVSAPRYRSSGQPAYQSTSNAYHSGYVHPQSTGYAAQQAQAGYSQWAPQQSQVPSHAPDSYAPQAAWQQPQQTGYGANYANSPVSPTYQQTTLPPVSLQQLASPPPPPQLQSIASPPPQTSAPQLGRSHTISYQQQQQPQLERSNTVTAAVHPEYAAQQPQYGQPGQQPQYAQQQQQPQYAQQQQQQPQYAHQQPQQQQQPPPPPPAHLQQQRQELQAVRQTQAMLASAPAAPNVVPQYFPSAPTALPQQEERKEALLIDL